MLTSTYFAFILTSALAWAPSSNECPFWKVENQMSVLALIQMITIVDISHFYITWVISKQFSRRDLSQWLSLFLD